MPVPESLRRTAFSVFLLLAALVFLVPATKQRDVSAARDPSLVYGPFLPADAVLAPPGAEHGPPAPVVLDAAVAPSHTSVMRDAYVAPAPGVPLPIVTSPAYAVIERACGAMVLGTNAHERRPPASLTKVITALVVLQKTTPDIMVGIDVDHRAPQFEASSLMGLTPGMRLSVQDLLYGLMLPSGNDAAEALARFVGAGDVGAFVSMMNDEAAALGLTDTRFANPSGLDAPDLYSSAWDMAVAGRAALANPLIMHMSTTLTYKPRWDGPALRNGNALLRAYPGAFGLKIGFTDEAKQTIVAAAERNGRQLIVSVLSSDDRYGDSRALLDWAFQHTPRACG